MGVHEPGHFNKLPRRRLLWFYRWEEKGEEKDPARYALPHSSSSPPRAINSTAGDGGDPSIRAHIKPEDVFRLIELSGRTIFHLSSLPPSKTGLSVAAEVNPPSRQCRFHLFHADKP